MKDRPAAYIIRKLLLSKQIGRDATIVESSSGNFGVALAAVCRAEGLRFVCVTDPIILQENRFLLQQCGAEIEEVTTPDTSGSYLKARIARAQEIAARIPGGLWVNQYANESNAQSHYYGTGMEIYKTFADVGLDYVFVPVSSGGAITGISRLLKEVFPNIQIVAVDAVGSVIFGGDPTQRHIPGMGSSIRPKILADARIDHVVMVDEVDIVASCTEILRRFGIFVGGSSGAAYRAAKLFAARPPGYTFAGSEFPQGHARTVPRALMIFPDRGDRYASTIYNQGWVARAFPSRTSASRSYAEPLDRTWSAPADEVREPA